MKPLFVETIWSESPDLDNHKVWNFSDFEAAAEKSALDHTTGGYLKTKVNVLFDDGSRTQVRIDLNATGDKGFRSYVDQVMKYVDSKDGKDYLECATEGEREFIKHLSKVEFG